MEDPFGGFAEDEGGGLFVHLDEFFLGLELLVEEVQGLGFLVFGQCGSTGKWWSLVGNIDSLSSACSFTGGFMPWGG